MFNSIPIIGKVLDGIIEIIDKKIADEDLKEKLKAEIKSLAYQTEIEELKRKSDIVLAESTGNFFQRSWRPILMYVFILILFNNYILFPYLSMVTDKVKILEFPEQFWYLLIVGVGGYIGGRTYEKTTILRKLLNNPISKEK